MTGIKKDATQLPTILIKPKPESKSFKRLKDQNPKTVLNPNPTEDRKNQNPAYALKSDDGKNQNRIQILKKTEKTKSQPMLPTQR